MSLRSSAIYVEPKTVRRLILVTKLYPERVVGDSGMATREKTADERGDTLLNEAIKEKYGEVIELEKQIAQVEKAFFERVKQQQIAKG